MGTAKRTSATPASIHQLKVTLKGIRPPIWRRIQVPSDVTLAKLHGILQVTLGWHHSHLHQFRVGETTYGDRSVLEDVDIRSERTARLNHVAASKQSKLWYDYDFGDGWEHEIVVEAVLPPAPGVGYLVCLTGRRACPPEDCGGIWGYADMLEIIRTPAHDEHASMMEWLGGPFDPEAFDLVGVNRRLAEDH